MPGASGRIMDNHFKNRRNGPQRNSPILFYRQAPFRGRLSPAAVWWRRRASNPPRSVEFSFFLSCLDILPAANFRPLKTAPILSTGTAIPKTDYFFSKSPPRQICSFAGPGRPAFGLQSQKVGGENNNENPALQSVPPTGLTLPGKCAGCTAVRTFPTHQAVLLSGLFDPAAPGLILSR